MERMICQCGFATEKAHQWDHEYEQCKSCGQMEREHDAMRAYIGEFNVGDMVWIKGKMYILHETKPEDWVVLDPTTLELCTYRWHLELVFGNGDIEDMVKKCPPDDLTND
jgi:hypothetical protein